MTQSLVESSSSVVPALSGAGSRALSCLVTSSSLVWVKSS
jgi:hypothetical protein